MNRKLLLASALIAGSSLAIQAQDLVLSEGQYYTDETQTTPYTGRYTEFYDDGMLKVELYTYKDGEKDGPWRIWNDKGIMRFEMFYTRGKKSGIWRTWNDEGVLLTEEKHS